MVYFIRWNWNRGTGNTKITGNSANYRFVFTGTPEINTTYYTSNAIVVEIDSGHTGWGGGN